MTSLANSVCEPLIDVERAAELLDCSPKTVKNYALAGKIPGVRIGNRWKFRASVLDEWVRAQIQSPAPLVAADNRKEKR